MKVHENQGKNAQRGQKTGKSLATLKAQDSSYFTTVKPDELRLLPHCRKPVSHGLKVNFYAERKPKMQYVTIDR